jgi:hypothetical protein
VPLCVFSAPLSQVLVHFVIEFGVVKLGKTAMTEMTPQPPNGKIQIGLMIKDFMPVLANQVELDIDMLILLKS